MKCKNCETELSPKCKYCNQCGALVVSERITLKRLLSTFFEALGWDNRFFVTFRDLLIRPQLVFEKYLGGTRKRYTNPFAFFAIGAALSVLLINFYFDDMVEITKDATQKQNEAIYGASSSNELDEANPEAEFRARFEAGAEKFLVFQYKYYYYVSFLFLPFLALISFWVFGKPCNFGEHLVINTFIQGFLFIVGLLIMALALIFNSAGLFNGSLLITFIYYCYAYGRYYKLSFGRMLLKILKFIGILLGIMLVIAIVAGGVAYISKAAK